VHGGGEPVIVDAATFAQAFDEMLKHPRAPWLTPYTEKDFAVMVIRR
jgi:hypothetical protein